MLLLLLLEVSLRLIWCLYKYVSAQKIKFSINNVIVRVRFRFIWCLYKHVTAQKMKFSIEDFFSKCDQIRNEKIHFLCSVLFRIAE